MNSSKIIIEEPRQVEVASRAVAQATARSSNLRVKKKFTDREVDDYLDESFDYISRYFESSLEELQQRNENITAKFIRVDTNTFTASIYDEGARASECTIWKGGENSFAGGIVYSSGITSSRNSYNESLWIENDKYSLNLRCMGMNRFGLGETSKDNKLSQEGGAEYLWGMLIEPLQR